MHSTEEVGNWEEFTVKVHQWEPLPNSDPKAKVTSFTEYQRKIWFVLSQGAVSRFYHERDPVQGSYKIRKIGWIPHCFYWLVWTNTSIKVSKNILETKTNFWCRENINVFERLPIYSSLIMSGWALKFILWTKCIRLLLALFTK